MMYISNNRLRVVLTPTIHYFEFTDSHLILVETTDEAVAIVKLKVSVMLVKFKWDNKIK